jgi:arylsulfatase A-like enzyme
MLRRLVKTMMPVLFLALCLSGCGEPQQKPNIVFIYIDDMGWTDVGFMGSQYYETPNIDVMASQGMVFTNAYANAPNCAPSRACLMSGQYTPRHGIYTVKNSDRGESKDRQLIPIPTETVLPLDKVTIAEALKSAGYVNASMGKWHLGTGAEGGPLSQGFDVNVGGNIAGHPPNGYFSPYKNNDLPDGTKGEYLTDRLTDEAIQFIEDNRNQPFFLYLTHYAVHTPIQGKPDIIAKYVDKPEHNGQDNPEYAAMVESVDIGVGRIMAKLDALGLSDNTVVIFYSDNGGYAGATNNAPLRGHKGMPYEGGIREPLAIRWPEKIRSGSTNGTPVIGVDFYPTLLAMAGAELPHNKVLDGEDLMPLLTEKGALERDAIFWHFPAYLQSGGGEKKRGYTKPFRSTPFGAVRKGNWKLIEFFEDGALELYNIKEDISETRNRAGEMPEKTAELHQLMKEWRLQVQAPVPMERNPEYMPR